MFALPIIYVAGLPTSLTVFASTEATSGYDRIAESFRLFWNAAHNEWVGASSLDGFNLKVFIDKQPGNNIYDVTLQVRDGLSIQEQYTWPDQVIPPGPPFDTALFIRPAGPTAPTLELHAIN